MTEAVLLLPKVVSSKTATNDVKKGETSSFKVSLEEAKGLPQSEEPQAEIKAILEKLDQAIKVLNGNLQKKDMPGEMKKALQTLMQLFKTIKSDIKEGKPPSSEHMKTLFKVIGHIKTQIHKYQPLNNDHLKPIVEDLKADLGEDLIPMLAAVVQTIVSSFGLQKPHEIHSVDEPSQAVTNNHHIGDKPSLQKPMPKGTSNEADTPPSTVQKSANKNNGHMQKVDQKYNVPIVKRGSVDDGASDKSTLAQNSSRSSQNVKVETTQWVSGGPIHRLQQFVLHSEVKTPAPPNPGAQILDQVRAVLSKANIKPLPDGGLQLTIKLNPAHLGRVQVVLTQTDIGLQATLTAQSQATKDLLQSQLSQLKQSFAGLGVTVHKLDVGQMSQPQQNPSQFNGQAFQQHTGGDAQDGQHHGRGRHHVEVDQYDGDKDSSFEDWLREGGTI